MSYSRSLGIWSVMSMLTSRMASTAAGLMVSAGAGAGGADLDGVAGEVAQPAGGHLGAAGFVNADEQHAGLVRHGFPLPVGGVGGEVGELGPHAGVDVVAYGARG